MCPKISRRRFIGTAMSTVGAGLAGFGPKVFASPNRRGGGLYPGRGVTVWHPEIASGHNVDLELAAEMVDRGLMALTGELNAVAAMEILLPGLTQTSKIAIKVNLIAGPSNCWTRWELIQALVNRLTETLNGSFPPENITVFDQHDLESHGYTVDRFPGVALSGSNQCNSGVMIPTPGTSSELSRFIADAQFLINCPVLKNHGSNEFTLGMKNHYGSIYPSWWCGNYDGLLAINTFSHIKEKTAFVLLDGIFGTFVSGLGGGPDNWTLFPGNTPQRIFLATDPCVAEHLGQRIINEQREASNQDPLTDYYLYRAGESPYELGVTDSDQMDIEFVDASQVSATEGNHTPEWFGLGVATPNPFRNSTRWKLSLNRSTQMKAAVYDLSGKRIATLHVGEIRAGIHVLEWDGRAEAGGHAGTGSYVLKLKAEGASRSALVTLIR